MTGKTAWAGLVLFAGAMLIVVGAVNVIEGIVALANARHVVVTEDTLYFFNISGWGWTVLVLGVLLLAVGIGVLTAQTWARVAAIVVVAVHAVVQVLWIAAYPVWSILMLALDTVILYALTARWEEVRRITGAERPQH
ncbi:hypothetical protein [Dactylosporangium sp. NPDC048998]|uniref:DUF7144 family membrane protein n=1 Tax=Dactylosporangium sp. NPDC048998 TaxID=3363976 RepID=UPI0037164720